MTERRTRLAAWTNINNSCNPKVLTPGSQCRATMSSRTTRSLVHRPRPTGWVYAGSHNGNQSSPTPDCQKPMFDRAADADVDGPHAIPDAHSRRCPIRRCNNGAAETCDVHLHLSWQQMSKRSGDT